MPFFLGDKLLSPFFTATNAYNEYLHAKAMEKIKKENPKAYNYVMEEKTHLWARYKFDPDLKAPENTTNFVESFNAKMQK